MARQQHPIALFAPPPPPAETPLSPKLIALEKRLIELIQKNPPLHEKEVVIEVFKKILAEGRFMELVELAAFYVRTQHLPKSKILLGLIHSPAAEEFWKKIALTKPSSEFVFISPPLDTRAEDHYYFDLLAGFAAYRVGKTYICMKYAAEQALIDLEAGHYAAAEDKLMQFLTFTETKDKVSQRTYMKNISDYRSLLLLAYLQLKLKHPFDIKTLLWKTRLGNDPNTSLIVAVYTHLYQQSDAIRYREYLNTYFSEDEGISLSSLLLQSCALYTAGIDRVAERYDSQLMEALKDNELAIQKIKAHHFLIKAYRLACLGLQTPINQERFDDLTLAISHLEMYIEKTPHDFRIQRLLHVLYKARAEQCEALSQQALNNSEAEEILEMLRLNKSFSEKIAEECFKKARLQAYTAAQKLCLKHLEQLKALDLVNTLSTELPDPLTLLSHSASKKSFDPTQLMYYYKADQLVQAAQFEAALCYAHKLLVLVDEQDLELKKMLHWSIALIHLMNLEHSNFKLSESEKRQAYAALIDTLPAFYSSSDEPYSIALLIHRLYSEKMGEKALAKPWMIRAETRAKASLQQGSFVSLKNMSLAKLLEELRQRELRSFSTLCSTKMEAALLPLFQDLIPSLKTQAEAYFNMGEAFNSFRCISGLLEIEMKSLECIGPPEAFPEERIFSLLDQARAMADRYQAPGFFLLAQAYYCAANCYNHFVASTHKIDPMHSVLSLDNSSGRRVAREFMENGYQISDKERLNIYYTQQRNHLYQEAFINIKVSEALLHHTPKYLIHNAFYGQQDEKLYAALEEKKAQYQQLAQRYSKADIRVLNSCATERTELHRSRRLSSPRVAAGSARAASITGFVR